MCEFVRTFRAQQHIHAETNAQCMLLKNTVKESVETSAMVVSPLSSNGFVGRARAVFVIKI